MGCQDLMEDIPGRSRKPVLTNSPSGDLKSFFSKSKSYNVKDEISSESVFKFQVNLKFLWKQAIKQVVN